MKTASGYIVSPLYDHVLIIGAPLIFMGVAMLLFYSGLEDVEVMFRGNSYGDLDHWMYVFAYIFTMSHLSLVFFRSHLNLNIFKQFPARFTLVPLVGFAGLYCSDAVLALALACIPWFDVYHSSLQTFGLGRIYDLRAGNDLQVGRRLDYCLALVTYAGPILAGEGLYRYIKSFRHFEDIEWHKLASIPGWALEHQHQNITPFVIGGAVLFLCYYLYRYWQYQKLGYVVTWQKVALHVSLAVCSVYTWGFNSYGQAFFIMESYHALQYYALVWWSENKNVQSRLGVDQMKGGKIFALSVILGTTFAYGGFAYIFSGSARAVTALLLIVEFLHYWYDGFVWSVRKKQVA